MPTRFYDNYKNNGFHFPTSLLTTYCLSLKTKPFIILSGISGTGKTKIAQLFAHIETSSSEAAAVTQEEGTVILKLPSALFPNNSGDKRGHFAQPELPLLLTTEELEEWNAHKNHFGNLGEANWNKQFTPNARTITIRTPHGSFVVGFFGQRVSKEGNNFSGQIKTIFKSRAHTGVELTEDSIPGVRTKYDPDFDSIPFIIQHFQPNDILELRKVGEKEFEVISVNDQRVQQVQQNNENEYLEKECFIPVRSDWTDNTELFGHYNLIEQKYYVTKLLKFILTAKEHPNHAFFVILDEMNLSKVEHYFSDFLSCLESRRIAGQELLQEKILLHSGQSSLMTNDEDFETIPNEIEIPINLYVTGTVNIDESTYMFSPKVLDRANVIEFNNVDLTKYGLVSQTEDNNDDIFQLSVFPDFTEFEIATKRHYEELSPRLKQLLEKINSILAMYHKHFGYRTANEVALFIKNAKRYIASTDEIENKALDLQFVQKIFPKLSGGYASLELPLKELLKELAPIEKNIEEITLEDITNIESTQFPITTAKLKRMYLNLLQNGFTSFIE